MDILLMGPPGAGKGTQGALLAERSGCPSSPPATCCGTRSSGARRSGCKAKAVMEAGHLVGDDIILGVVREELAKPEAAKGVIFDGVVRTIPQAEGVERILAEQGRKMDRGAVLRRHATTRSSTRLEQAARRSRSRADDDPAAVATRLKAYREQTAPVLDWYESRNGRASDPRGRLGRGDRGPGPAGASAA